MMLRAKFIARAFSVKIELSLERAFEKIKERTRCYIPIANWSYKAYSLFDFETGTTTTVFDLPDNLHG